MASMFAIRAIVFTGLLPLALAACQNDEPLGRGFGESIERNAAAQIINPAPERAGQTVPDMAGTRAAGAIERYDTGKVIDARTDTTTKSISAGSTGGAK